MRGIKLYHWKGKEKMVRSYPFQWYKQAIRLDEEYILYHG
jgi:hypothetical protein